MTMWVFGYGSLLWNPGFLPEERAVATLRDYHRSFCMLSIHHRGTEERPGLVLALDALSGAQCTGVAFRVAEAEEAEVLEYLRARELISSAYVEHHVTLDLADGRAVGALAYVIDPDHVQYCGGMPLEEQAHMIAHAVGGRGPNTEYLYNTVSHLDEMGVRDDDLKWLTSRVRQIVG
jgi:cation transport protein ChaC